MQREQRNKTMEGVTQIYFHGKATQGAYLMLYVGCIVLQFHKSQFHMHLKQTCLYRIYTYVYVQYIQSFNSVLIRIAPKQLLIICISRRMLTPNLLIWSQFYLNLLFLTTRQKPGDQPLKQRSDFKHNTHTQLYSC